MRAIRSSAVRRYTKRKRFAVEFCAGAKQTANAAAGCLVQSELTDYVRRSRQRLICISIEARRSAIRNRVDCRASFVAQRDYSA